MPKEWAHWHLAVAACDALGDGELKACLTRRRSEYLLGAVSPDTLYYLLRDDRNGGARSAADRIHGTSGENTYSFLHRALRVGGRCGAFPDEIKAFLCGFTAHVIADATFHPLVYYVCGKSNELHWAFETAMDRYVRTLAPGTPRRYRYVERTASPGFTGLAALLSAVFFDRAVSRHVRRAIRSAKIVQSAFDSRWAYGAARAIAFVVRGRARSLLRLFYRGVEDLPLRAFSRTIRYRHPVSGEAREDTFDSLRRRFVERLIPDLEIMYEAMSANDSRSAIEKLERTISGPSLETGLPEGSPTELRYTDAHGFDTFFHRTANTGTANTGTTNNP